MKKYTHLFFDLDHTLWDFEKNSTEAMKDSFEQLAIGDFLEAEYVHFDVAYTEINQHYWERFRNGAISREDLRWKRMQATFLHFKKLDDKLAKQLSTCYLDLLPTKTNLFPFAHEVLTYCTEQDYDLHLITNGFEATQKQKLANTNLSSFFGEMISSERAMSIKPQPAIFEYAMEQTKAKAKESLMIGDHFDVDIRGAMNVGMDQIYFNPSKRENEDRATYEVSCLSELFDIL